MAKARASKSDEILRSEAESRLAKSGKAQVLCELVAVLREAKPGWWTPEGLRERFNAQQRMEWLSDRPDRRQQITSSLTGLASGASRALPPDRQAEIIDAAVDNGDCTVAAFEIAFTPEDIAVHGARSALWQEFRARFPMSNPSNADRAIFATVLEILLATGQGQFTRKQSITPIELRRALGSRAFEEHLPLAIRVALDEGRLAKDGAWSAEDDLAIATPQVLADNLPLTAFESVLDVAEGNLALRSRKKDEVGSAAELGTDLQFDFTEEAQGSDTLVTAFLPNK